MHDKSTGYTMLLVLCSAATFTVPRPKKVLCSSQSTPEIQKTIATLREFKVWTILMMSAGFILKLESRSE